jgi:hypothetical protein
MKAVVSALLALSLVLLISCTNDDNTVEPIEKYHSVYPVFHLKIDNGHRTFGIDSLQLTTNPGIGWPGPVYTDIQGFVGTLAGGTFVDYVDTIPDADTVIYDTTWKVYGFQPSTTYNFTFSRTEPFIWRDSFRADYAISVDSSWLLFSADTVEVTKALDPANPPETILYKVVKNPASTLIPKPDDTIMQSLLIGYWFDSGYVVSNPDDTVDYPPDSTRDSTIMWGLWHRVDSFYLPPDSNIWCQLDSIVEVMDTVYDLYDFPSIITDSVYYYSQCDKKIDTVQLRIYRHYDWGVYPGGDNSAAPIPSFDTTIHFTYPDTLKTLAVNHDGLSILVPIEDPDTHDTTWVPKDVTIEFTYDGVSQTVDSLSLNLTLPPVEVFPQYDFIIREVPSGK